MFHVQCVFIFRAIEEKDSDKEVVEEMKKILQLLQGHEEPKAEGGKGSKGLGGRRSTTPDEKYAYFINKLETMGYKEIKSSKLQEC